MKYDGVVVKIELDKIFLFILDPDTNKIRDGINISGHKCYDPLTDEQLMVVGVIFKDGTQEIDKIDLDEFIYGDTYGVNDTFIYINDLMLFSMSDEIDVDKKVKLKKLIDDGGLNDIAINCINTIKKQQTNNE